MRFSSLRVKVSLASAGLLTLTFILLGAWVHHDLSRRLERSLEDLLQARADGIADSIDTYWETERMSAAERGVPFDKIRPAGDPEFARIAMRWVEARSKDPGLLSFVVRVLDPSGRILAASAEVLSTAGGAPGAIRSALEGQSRFDDVAVELPPGHASTMRMLTLPVIENDRVAYIVQVLSPSVEASGALRSLRLALLVLVPIVLALSGAIGAMIARFALRPIGRMTDTARRIGADNLRLRIEAPAGRDEIRRLADTFNDMLGRVEDGFVSQRRFLDDLAHELKTPLAVLKGELEVTLRKSRPAREYATALASGLDEVERLIRIVDELLLLARVDRSVVALDREPVELDTLARGVVQAMRGLAEGKGVALRLEAASGAAAEGDESMLERLLVNLVDNAIKYTPGGGAVTVATAFASGEASVSVADTGPGVPEEDLPRVFDRFFRARPSGGTEGIGLGLSIARSIAEAHGGRIEVRSRPGNGSVFTLRIPARERA